MKIGHDRTTSCAIRRGQQVKCLQSMYVYMYMQSYLENKSHLNKRLNPVTLFGLVPQTGLMDESPLASAMTPTSWRLWANEE